MKGKLMMGASMVLATMNRMPLHNCDFTGIAQKIRTSFGKGSRKKGRTRKWSRNLQKHQGNTLSRKGLRRNRKK